MNKIIYKIQYNFPEHEKFENSWLDYTFNGIFENPKDARAELKKKEQRVIHLIKIGLLGKIMMSLFSV